MFDNRVLVAFVYAVAAIPSIGAIQDRGASTASAATKVDVSIGLKVAGRPYNFSGKARCTHAPSASYYDLNGQTWKVDHDEGQASVHFSFWRPTGGSGDMFTLYGKINGKSYFVSTVKTSGGGAVQGSGKATFTSSKPRGTFTIEATAADGVTITGTIKCSAFSPVVDEGG